eukprot:gnl/TRDRNA2_/TRDRNA2_58141_c0_seq1.p1 gnl/TRDRNA2_/TRDRNA2_58141_c0~~gnl/TRDRNA2_/TRDRNA2_58141_c0_seq1.p1  ORF type:complete len:157 (+),score=18.67 gnl/TRDRNA2_/TRDRNA2_58141_c0_seq1:119-589(+)
MMVVGCFEGCLPGYRSASTSAAESFSVIFKSCYKRPLEYRDVAVILNARGVKIISAEVSVNEVRGIAVHMYKVVSTKNNRRLCPKILTNLSEQFARVAMVLHACDDFSNSTTACSFEKLSQEDDCGQWKRSISNCSTQSGGDSTSNYSTPGSPRYL